MLARVCEDIFSRGFRRLSWFDCRTKGWNWSIKCSIVIAQPRSATNRKHGSHICIQWMNTCLNDATSICSSACVHKVIFELMIYSPVTDHPTQSKQTWFPVLHPRYVSASTSSTSDNGPCFFFTLQTFKHIILFVMVWNHPKMYVGSLVCNSYLWMFVSNQ